MRISEYGRQEAGDAAQSAHIIEQGAARLGSTAAEVGNQVEKQQTLHEVSQGAAASSALLANGAADWDNTLKTADPNNLGQARQDFLDRQQKRYDQFSSGFSTGQGKLWGAEHVANLQTHFNEKTIADVSRAAGESLKINVAQTADNLAAAIHNDPSTLDAALTTMKSSIDAMVANAHGLSGEDAIGARSSLNEEAQRRLAHLGVASTMDHNVAAGEAMLSGKYGSLLRPEDVQELQNYGKAVTRAKQADADHATLNQMRAEQKASEAQANRFLSSMAPPGPDGRPGPMQVPDGAREAVLRDQTMKPSEKMTVIGFMDREQTNMQKDETPRNDPQVSSDLIQRLGDAANPTTQEQIAKQVKEGNLTPQFGMELLAKSSSENSSAMAKLADNPIVKTEFDRASAQLTGATTMLTGPNSAVKYQIDQFKADTLRTLQDAAMNKQDVSHFLDPKDPDYLFSPARIEQYRPTKEQIKLQLVAPKQTDDGKPTTGVPGKTAPAQRPDLGEIMSKALNFAPKAAPPAADKYQGFN